MSKAYHLRKKGFPEIGCEESVNELMMGAGRNERKMKGETDDPIKTDDRKQRS